jgi:hypothetical protein
MVVKRLGRDDLIRLVENVFHPVDGALTAEAIDEQLLIFCLNCPDPGAAMDLVVEAPQDCTPVSVVEHALAMTPRAVDTWSESELALDHPLRRWKLEETSAHE